MRKKLESLEKQVMQGTTPLSRTRGRPKTAVGMDNILQWTGYTSDQTLIHVFWRQSQVDEDRSWCGQASERGWL